MDIKMAAEKFGYLLCIACVSSLWIIPCASGTPQKKVKLEIAVILPEDTFRLFSIAKVKPAIEYAVESLFPKSQLMIPKEDICIRYADSRCDSVHAPIAAFDFHSKHQVHVFFGPVCDYSLAPVARYAPFWNIPVISPGGMAHDFGETKSAPDAEFPLLTRVGWTFDSLAQYLEKTITHYKWTQIKVMYDSFGHSAVSESFCWLAMSGLINRLRIYGSLSFHLYSFSGFTEEEEYTRMLKEEVGAKFAGER